MESLSSRLSARRTRGTSLVEMAFVLPVLLLLMLGLADFALVFHDYIAATNAARAGVRAATLTMLDCKTTTLEDAGRAAAQHFIDVAVVKDVKSMKFEHSAPSQEGLCKPGYVTLTIHVESRHRALEGFFGDPNVFPRIEFAATAGAMSENGF
jgi:Flp pilus assembly protein TadG